MFLLVLVSPEREERVCTFEAVNVTSALLLNNPDFDTYPSTELATTAEVNR